MDQPRFFTEMAVDDGARSIGAAVLAALGANHVDPQLDYPTDILDTVTAAGLTSYSQFTRGAKYVNVVAENDSEYVEVGVTDGTQHPGSFVGAGDTIRSDGLTSESVGQAVIEGLRRCVARPTR